MATRNTGGAAFPRPAEGFRASEPGMTVRDAFAKDAMQAAIAGHISYYGHESNHWQTKDIADYAYQMADAMLKARQ